MSQRRTLAAIRAMDDAEREEVYYRVGARMLRFLALVVLVGVLLVLIRRHT